MALLSGYALLVYFAPPAHRTYQNQGDMNAAKAQQMLFGPERDIVVVGSSLAARLDAALENTCIYNLSFAGGSPLQGLTLIRKAGKKPRIVLIEINELLGRTYGEKYFDAANIPLAHISRLFWVENKPVNFAISQFVSLAGLKGQQRKTEKVDPNKIAIGIKLSTELLSKTVTPEKVQNSLLTFTEIVSQFENEGVNIYFFEMPIDPALRDLVRPRQAREIIKNAFGERFVEVWTPEEIATVSTSDGKHLLSGEAEKLSKKLIEKYPCGMTI